jgi:hypothetical protein
MSDNRTDKYLGMAADEARYSDMYHKHGAVLVKGGRVVAKGHNSRRTRLHGANHWYPPACPHSPLLGFISDHCIMHWGAQLDPRRNERPVSF